MSAGGAGGDGGVKQRFELYIKASAIDKETKGSCPICQHWFMITCRLGEVQDDIDFKVYTVQADCPPKNFGVEQGWSKKFPVVMVLEGHDKKDQDLAGTKYDTFEELETFFQSINKDCPELKRTNAPNVAAMNIVENVYSCFNAYLSSGNPKRLKSELQKIDEYLESEESTFLVDNVLSFADCYLLPRLQHIRVAGKAYFNFDIPEEYTHIWRYLKEAYKTETFRSTVPSNQDILFHYEKKVSSSAQRPKLHPRPTLQNFTYTLDIPENIAARISDNGEVFPPPKPEERSSENGNILPPPAREEFSQVDISQQSEEDTPQQVAEEAVQHEIAEQEVQQQVTEQEVVASGQDVVADDDVGSASADADDVVNDSVPNDADATVCESVTSEQAVVTQASAPADDSFTASDAVASDGTAGEGGDDIDQGSGAVSENVIAEGDHVENVACDVECGKDTVEEEANDGVSNGDGDAKKEEDDIGTTDEVVKGDDATAPASGPTE